MSVVAVIVLSACMLDDTGAVAIPMICKDVVSPVDLDQAESVINNPAICFRAATMAAIEYQQHHINEKILRYGCKNQLTDDKTF